MQTDNQEYFLYHLLTQSKMLFNTSGKIEVHFNDRESSVRHVIFLSTSHGQLLTICYRVQLSVSRGCLLVMECSWSILTEYKIILYLKNQTNYRYKDWKQYLKGMYILQSKPIYLPVG